MQPILVWHNTFDFLVRCVISLIKQTVNVIIGVVYITCFMIKHKRNFTVGINQTKVFILISTKMININLFPSLFVIYFVCVLFTGRIKRFDGKQSIA